MMSQKRLGYGSRGRQIPAIPHVSNSVQGKRTTRRNDGLAENLSTRNEAESTVKSLAVKSNMPRDSSVRCTRPCEISHGLGIICEYGAFGVCHPRSSSSAEAGQAHQAELDGRPTALLSSNSSSGVLLCSHDKEHKAASLSQVEMQHAADRDDGENSSGCTHPSTTGNEGYKPHFLGNHRIRKLLASKVRKAACNKTSGGVFSKGSKLNFCGKKISTTRQKVQKTNFKRKRLARGTAPVANWRSVVMILEQNLSVE